MPDRVNHPPHYTSHPARCPGCGSGIECITIVEHHGFNVGNAIKYLWRADLKGDAVEDLRKAAWYVNREIQRQGRTTDTPPLAQNGPQEPRTGLDLHRPTPQPPESLTAPHSDLSA